MSHKTHYSCAELAEMKLPGYPTSCQGWEKIIKREVWEFNEHKSRGRGGIRREYLPSSPVQAIIRTHHQIQARGTGLDVTLTLTVSLAEASYITRWLERKAHRG